MTPRTTGSALASLLVLVVVAGAPPAAAQEDASIFHAATVVVDQHHRFRHLLDVDGDGFQDVLDWEEQNGDVVVTIWRNDGAGGLTQTWQREVENVTEPLLAIGDYNGDGRDDVVGELDQTMGIWYGRTNGGLLAGPSLGTSSFGYRHLLLTDTNADGREDLVFQHWTDFEVWLNPGSEVPPTPHATSDASIFATHLLPIDANGDETPDLLLAGNVQMRIYPVVDGVVGAYSHVFFALNPAVFDDPVMNTVGDIDLDGDDDIVVFGPEAYAVVRQTAPGSFVLEPTTPGGPASMLADIDGDRDLDGVCCGGGTGGGGGPGNGGPSLFEISVNDGFGNFAPAFQLPGLASYAIAGAADMDHDGDMDLVAGRCVFWGDGPFAPSMAAAAGTAELAPTTFWDVDCDGDPDVEPTWGVARRNDGAGGFQYSAPPILPVPPPDHHYSGQGIPGDFDGDGDLDLVITTVRDGTSQPVNMRLLANDGAGSFVDVARATDGGQVMAPGGDPVVADADGDGDLDVVTVLGEPAHQSELWLNDGSGFFVLAETMSDLDVHAVAHLDGDAWPDLVVVAGDGTDWSVAFRLGLGGGAFGAVEWLPTERRDDVRTRMAVADLDADGDVDIATIDQSSGRLDLHRNTGLGTFVEVQLSGADAYLDDLEEQRVFAVDVNADGRLDLVASPPVWAGNGANLILRNASGTGWRPPLQQIVAPSHLADVDGDGDAEVLTDRVVRNRTHEGPEAGARLQAGGGVPGLDGTTPILGATGPFRVGEMQSLRISGARADGLALLYTGLGDPPAFTFGGPAPGMGPVGATTRWDLGAWRAIALAPDAVAGAGGRAVVDDPIPASLLGLTVHHQLFVRDAEAANATAISNVLHLTYGP